MYVKIGKKFFILNWDEKMVSKDAYSLENHTEKNKMKFYVFHYFCIPLPNCFLINIIEYSKRHPFKLYKFMSSDRYIHLWNHQPQSRSRIFPAFPTDPSLCLWPQATTDLFLTIID